MFFPIMRSQENDIVSSTKDITKKNVAAKRYWNYSKRIIKKTTIRVYYIKETSSKLNVTSMNFEMAGFH